MIKQVTITSKDLQGQYMSNHDCPLARSIKREYKAKNVTVGGKGTIHNYPYTMLLLIDGEKYQYDTRVWNFRVYLEMKADSLRDLTIKLTKID